MSNLERHPAEFSTGATTVLHGAQLCGALPESERGVAPGFEHYAPPFVEVDAARVLVFLGSLLGPSSPVAVHSRVVGAEIRLKRGQALTLPVDAIFEYGTLVDSGTLTVAGTGQPVRLPNLRLRPRPTRQDP